ncbi:NACHT domain-containing protein [Crossiella sp. CA198]|uniref:NACHT domain-containing protein n=1 Tax=Crossiella sp. CA198 TaxID=3455607 RepID=UPI003F8D77D1
MISGVEVLKLGQTVATRAAAAWLRKHRERKERVATLAELAAEQLAGPLHLRKWDNFLNNLGLQIAERLEPLLDNRFPGLPGNEIQAALDAAGDALAEVELSDDLLLGADLDADKLAAHVRSVCPGQVRVAGLSEDGARLYEVALDQSCRYLVEVVRWLPAFQPRALAEALGRLGALSGQLDEVLARIPRSTLHAPRGTGHDAEFTAGYLRHLQSTLDRLELLGLTMQEQPRLALSVAYLSLSVSETTQPRARRELADGRWFGEIERGPVSGRVEAAIGATERTLVRGEAGSGKTTLLDWLAVTAARGHFTGGLAEWNGCVPFPVRLRSFAAGELPRPEQLVAHAWPMRGAQMPEGWAHRRLSDGTGLVLLDGVDEVPAGQRAEVRNWLRQLVAEFPLARIVVTARPAAVEEKWLADEGFRAVLLEPMTGDDIRQFIERWHTAAEAATFLPCAPGDLPAARQRLLNQFANRPQLRALAANPLLCALLCALNLDHVADLPRSRMELYERALAMLLDIRDAKRRIAGLLDVAQKRVLLRDLAWRLTLANRIELPRDKALGHLARKLPAMPNVTEPAPEILDHLLERSGVLREPVPGRVDFLHRTFQEYLAASEATEQDHIDTLVAHAHLDGWWETVVMAAGHAKRTQADELLAEILDRADHEPRRARRLRLLAAACLETVQEIDAGLHDRIDTLIRTHLVPPRSIRETESLAAIGHRLLRYLPSTVDELSEAAAVATVQAAALTGSAEALTTLAGYARDPRHRVQQELIRAWRMFDPARYAEEVLADAPLHNGLIQIGRGRFLPHLAKLRRLTKVSVAVAEDQVSGLEVLDGLPLTDALWLRFDGQPVDLGPLLGHRGIRHLHLMGAAHYRRLDVLAQLPGLTDLTLYQREPWADLDFLRPLSGLRTLKLDQLTRITDYAALDDLPSLDRLSLNDLTRLDSSTGRAWATVRTLYFSWWADPRCLDQLAERFPALSSLRLFSGELPSAEPIAALPLRTLYLSRCGSPDLSPLGGRDIEIHVDGVARSQP